MGNKFNFYWEKIVTIGSLDSMNAVERVQLKILNSQGFYCVVTAFLFLIKGFSQGHEDVLQIFLILLIFSLVLILNHFNKLYFAKLYWTVLLPLLFCVMVMTYGNEPHGEMLFIISMVNIFILFEAKWMRILLTLFVVALCALALIHNNLYDSPLASTVDVTDAFGTFIMSTACIASIISYYTKALRSQLQISQINNQALQDANTDLEHFTYMASHNMKTPLRNILGSVFYMNRKIPKETMEIIGEYIKEIKVNANDMHTLIEDLMEYAVFVQKEMNNIETINLQMLAEKVVKSVNVSLEKNATFEYNGLGEIHANMTLIKAILQNLIENGVKYNNAEIPEIEVSVSKEKENILIKVIDNGIGIDEAYYSKIFVMFKRLHHNDEYEGTGIGLAMCKRLLNKSGGEIWLESEVEKGTTFFVRVPIMR